MSWIVLLVRGVITVLPFSLLQKIPALDMLVGTIGLEPTTPTMSR